MKNFLRKIYNKIGKTKLGKWNKSTEKWNWLKHVIIGLIIFILGLFIPIHNFELRAIVSLTITIIIALLWELFWLWFRKRRVSPRDMGATVGIPAIIFILIIIF